MERRNVNYNSCCRLCLNETLGLLRSIFNDQGLSQRIRDLVAVDINQNDKISTMICDPCTNQLLNWDRFRIQCTENQTKLLTRLNSWSNPCVDMSFHIKDEVVDEPEQEIVIDDDDEVRVKTEYVETVTDETPDDLLDLPPPLTPNPPGYSLEEDEEDEMLVSSGRIRLEDNVQIDDSSLLCKFCKKSFSTSGNRKKHEKMMHQIKKKGEDSNDDSDTSTLPPSSSHSPPVGQQSEQQKIQFAAGLKLRQKSQTTVESIPLTKLEVSYLDKCKSLCTMLETLECICHKEQFDDSKKMLSHLRKPGVWFPVPIFTCYHCLISFADRSTYTKHLLTCSKLPLQQLKRLTELKVGTDPKCRLYQNYRCLKCCCTFSFHEDFCAHLDIDHLEVKDSCTRPHKCLCGSEFNELDSYRDHISITCFLRYYCDICFRMFKDVDAFKDHCFKTHDNEETIMSERRDSEINGGVHISVTNAGKRDRKRLINTSLNPLAKKPHVEANSSLPINLEDSDGDGPKNYVVGNFIIPAPSPGQRRKKSICLICKRGLSSFHNMLRHLRTHEEVREHEKQTSEGEPKFSCPDCKHLFHSLEEWTAHKETHQTKSCKECGKTFVFQAELDQHRSAHLTIKLYRDSKTQDYKSAMISNIPSCRICNKTFASKSELRQHALLHEKMPVLRAHDAEDVDKKTQKDLNGGDKYACVPCKLTFSYYASYWEHNKNHHTKVKVVPHVYPRKCEGCDRFFSTGASYASHKKWHDRQEQQKQPIKQSLKVVNPVKLKMQKRVSYDDESYFTCKKCFKVFASRTNLKTHMKSHGNPSGPARKLKTYWCNVCHQACPGYSELQDHKEEHRSGGMPRLYNEDGTMEKPTFVACDICQKQFTTNFALKQHRARHNVKKKTLVYCKYCKMSFDTEDMLNRHMDNEHDESVGKKQTESDVKGDYKCNICYKDFNTSMALYSHRGWHKRNNYTGVNENGEEAPSPPKPQPAPSQSRRVQSKFKCGKCSKQFTNDTSLQIHILETHRNINTSVIGLQCNSCKISFDTQTGYDNHMQLHDVVEKQVERQAESRSKNSTNNKTYACKYCSITFNKKDSLNSHVKQNHKNKLAKIFECQQCDRFFEKSESLSLHMRVHKQSANKKARYNCSICPMSFELPKEMRDHVINSHPF